MSYNGWTNRETWLVNVWYNPETINDVEDASRDLEEKVAELSGILSDLIDISVINWQELTDTMDDVPENEGDV